MEFEVIIRNGTVFDGSGNDATSCDIGIYNGCITKADDLSSARAGKTIEAAGSMVCPGFIDAHSHSDVYLLIEPSAASKIHQGITTEICGNCGASAAPLNGEYRMPADWMVQLEAVRKKAGSGERDQGLHAKPSAETANGSTGNNHTCAGVMLPSWHTVAEYRVLYDEIKPAIHAALLVGHNTLHAGICGYEPRGGTPEEMKRMRNALEEALDEGAIGLSSGLAYPPGSAVPREELIDLAGVVAKRDALYTTHMRSESDGLLEAIDEAIDLARHTGIRLQISHLKASGCGNWNKLDAALGKIRTAGSELSIGSDRYPYTAGCTDLDIVLPEWASYGGRDAILARLRDPSTRTRIEEELTAVSSERWSSVMIGSTTFEAFKGKYLPEAAETLGLDPVEALLHIIDTDELSTGGIFFGMSEANMWQVLAEPYVSIGSDGSLRAPRGPLSSDHPHPRAYGSHTRFLRAALDGITVSLPEAIRKMTSLPAEQFRLNRRGLIKEGYHADIVVFDPDSIREHTTYSRPHSLSTGVRHLFVNGVHTINDGVATGLRAGTFLDGES